MNSSLVLLLLAALQVSCSCQWERPHIRCYSRWAKHRQPDSYEEHYDDSHLQAHHSDDIKPIHEDQHEASPSRRDFFPEESHSDVDSPESEIKPGHVCLHGRPIRHDGGEIYVNSIRPPYLGPNNNKIQIDDISAHSGIGIRPAQEFVSEGVSGEEYQSNAASLPGELINSQLGQSVSGGLTDQDVQASIANSAINQQIGAAALGGDSGPGNSLLPSLGPFGATPILPFLPSDVELPSSQPIIGPSPSLSEVAPIRPLPTLPSPNFCIRHRLVPVPVRVVEECITNVPVVRKTVRHQVETVTSHVPVTEKTVTQQHEKIVRHVPVTGKTLRNVVETRVRHIPVIKSRTRTVVEPYTVHVPVTIRFTRPVEESITKTVPVREVRSRPVVIQRTRLVPVIERRMRPVVEQQVHHVPVKRQYVRTVVEQRARPVVVPCHPCGTLPPQPIGLPLSLIQAQDIPRILLSPYSDFGETSSTLSSQPLPINSQLGATVPGGPSQRSENIILPSQINGQISTSGDHYGAVNSQLGVTIPAVPGIAIPAGPGIIIPRGPGNLRNIFPAGPSNGEISASSGDHSGIISYTRAGESRLSPIIGQIDIPPIPHRIIPNLHDTGCSPPPPSC